MSIVLFNLSRLFYFNCVNYILEIENKFFQNWLFIIVRHVLEMSKNQTWFIWWNLYPVIDFLKLAHMNLKFALDIVLSCVLLNIIYYYCSIVLLFSKNKIKLKLIISSTTIFFSVSFRAYPQSWEIGLAKIVYRRSWLSHSAFDLSF